MHTRDLVKKTFAEHGLYRSRDPKLKELLQAIDEQPLDCWPEFVARFRADYYELFDRVVPPLMSCGDPLIAAVLVHHADLSKAKERALITKYVQDADEAATEGVLFQIARLGDDELGRELAKKDLTPKLAAELARGAPKRRAPAKDRTIPPTAAARPAAQNQPAAPPAGPTKGGR